MKSKMEVFMADEFLENNSESVSVTAPPTRKIYSKIGFVLFTMAGITIALQSGLSVLFSSLKIDALNNSSWIVWLTTFVPLYLIAVPIGLLLLRKIPTEPAEKSKLSAKHFILVLIICIPIMYIGNLLGTVLASLISGGNSANALIDFAFDKSPLKIVVLVILAPVIEEYIFRKQIIDRVKKYGEKTAFFLSAFAFAMFHMSLYQFFYAFGLGLIFAYVYIRTGRLRYSVALHIIINFVGSVVAPWLASKVDLVKLSGL